MSEDEEFLRENKRLAEEARKAHRQSMSDSFSLVGTFGGLAMRAPALASAGGLAALLAFYSANKEALTAPGALVMFNYALGAFFVALMLSVVAPGAAYLSQSAFTSGGGSQEYIHEHPYVKETSISKRWRIAGAIFQVITIVVVIASLICLAFASVNVFRMINILIMPSTPV